MNKLKRFLAVIISSFICFGAVQNVSAVSSPDQSVLTTADDKYKPLYTIPSDNNTQSDDFAEAEKSSKDYALFYTQTTFLALLAGYLIIFKVKGIDHSQKMHRRINREN